MLYMTKEHAYRAIRELGKDALPALSTLEDLHGVGAQTKHQSHMPQPVIQAPGRSADPQLTSSQ